MGTHWVPTTWYFLKEFGKIWHVIMLTVWRRYAWHNGYRRWKWSGRQRFLALVRQSLLEKVNSWIQTQCNPLKNWLCRILFEAERLVGCVLWHINPFWLFMTNYIYIYICVCVCVCFGVWNHPHKNGLIQAHKVTKPKPVKNLVIGWAPRVVQWLASYTSKPSRVSSSLTGCPTHIALCLI